MTEREYTQVLGGASMPAVRHFAVVGIAADD
jgi:hypothetical protein